MAVVNTYEQGTFCWIDLATTDAGSAVVFYTSVFDWQVNDIPTPDGVPYNLFQQDGHDVCALYQMPSEMMQAGTPPAWNSFIAVDDADAMAEQVVARGGSVIQQPFNVMDFGRMAVLKDPDGAVFSFWQNMSKMGERIVNVPNTWCWNELYCNNPEQEIAFYEALFSWTHDISKNPMGLDYVTYKRDGQELAGMLQIQSDWGSMPPAWGVYFTVADVQETMAKVKAAGGKVLMDPMPIPGVGEFTSVTDPQGAFFNIIRLEQIPD
ncbi:MAG: VOC family protein [Gammaproteobacteria bacterium]|nr:VOC family protein [Gammaproteobacteria bacterium]